MTLYQVGTLSLFYFSTGNIFTLAKQRHAFRPEWTDRDSSGRNRPLIAPESVAGICAQGKSGLTSVTAGLLFLLAAFFVPVANYIPPALTACVMIYIGFTMLGAVKEIDCGDIGEGIPALLTILLIPVTSSIVDGIALGILFHVIVNVCIFKLKAIKPIEIVVAFFFGLNYFYL